MTRKRMFAAGGVLAVLLLPGCVRCPIAPTTKETGTNTNQVPQETASRTNQEPFRVVVSFPAKVHPTLISGRILLFMSRPGAIEPAKGIDFFDPQPVFGIEVTNLSPGAEVVFAPEKFDSPEALAFPTRLGNLDPGTYYAQALVDLDHLQFGFFNTGNLFSPLLKCEVGRGLTGGTIKLAMDQAMEQDPPKQDTDRVKGVEIRSKLLSAFYGREVMLRAGVVLPSTFSDHPKQQFPALYEIPSLFGGYIEAWDWPHQEQELKSNQGSLQMLHVFVDPACPLGHTFFANSANNGPVGDALVQELIPEIERRFRAIPQAYARFLSGHCSGGWASLWLQVNYPEFFGGCWSMSPNPVDYRAFQTLNIYEDRNGHWTREGNPRPAARVGEKVVQTAPQIDRRNYVIGTEYPFASFDAVFSPRGEGGKPRPLVNPLTGRIDPEVATHWRKYDILWLLKSNWQTLGPRLKGKLHVVVGGTDTFYLDTAVDTLKDFLKTTDYGGYVEILPGDHSDYIGPELMDRFNREMADHFAAGLRESPEPSVRPQGTTP